MIALQKPTYYLWRTDYTSSEDFEADKEKYRKIGFRVVAFADGQPDKNIHMDKSVDSKPYKRNQSVISMGGEVFSCLSS